MKSSNAKAKQPAKKGQTITVPASATTPAPNPAYTLRDFWRDNPDAAPKESADGNEFGRFKALAEGLTRVPKSEVDESR